MTAQEADTSTDRARPVTPGPWWGVVVAIVAARAGVMLGLWPLAIGSDGQVAQSNVLALAVHGLGAVAVVAFLLARSKPGTLLGLAYTGYSTIALGLNNPRPGLTVIVWVVGIATLAALVIALLRGGLGKAQRPDRPAVVITGVAMAAGAALGTAVAFLRW